MNEISDVSAFVIAWARASVAERFHRYDVAAESFLDAVNDAPTPEDATRAMQRAFAAADRAPLAVCR